MTRLVIEVRGIVQGIGFRPFVANAARALGLSGSVRNTAYGALIDCEGSAEACQALILRVEADAPPGALIFSISAREEAPSGRGAGFAILASDGGLPQAAVSPDLGICAACEAELFAPGDRRYGYPFVNCTRCGPRFSILARVPYDRANTAMAGFALCPACAREYLDPEDRRFHAQPNACPICGPRLFWLEAGGEVDCDPIERFGRFIVSGKIVAVKGLGGFHLACDPRNAEAVAELRLRKRRDEKPFAVLARDLDCVRAICELGEAEARELKSARRPIVLLRKRADHGLAEAVAPNLDRLGVMLADTPLHALIARAHPLLIMTSANISDEPMPYRDGDAGLLWPLCDALLTHNRPILRRVDDSVCVFHAGGRQLIRRARGFAPQPLRLRVPDAGDARVLAFGGQLKNTFCLLRGGYAYLSGHVGDLEGARACEEYEREISAFLELFGVRPRVLAFDLHPDYESTHLAGEYARRFPDARLVPVQHHRAHFASVLAEHGLERALGFVFDGTGYGEDGLLWGGEVFCGSIAGAARVGSLLPLRLPGGEAAIREPWRVAMWAVAEACSDGEALARFGRREGAEALLDLARRGVQAPLSSGMGRLFDAFAVIAGCADRVSYEGQAAIALEQAYDGRAEGRYRLELATKGPLLRVDWRAAVREAVRDRARGAGAGAISARFHRALIALVVEVAERFPGLPVALSGGVFQNLRLLEGARAALLRAGRTVYTNEAVPPNDAGISFGQAACAAAGGGDCNVSGDAGPADGH